MITHGSKQTFAKDLTMHHLVAADPTFVRLFADISLAKDIEQRIRHGRANPDKLRYAQELERRAWQHLANYTAAQAFASDMSSEEE
jgi:hypothetical protein